MWQTAASSDCSRPVNNYVHIRTADLYRPNARSIDQRAPNYSYYEDKERNTS